MDLLVRDVWHGLRNLWRQPGFALVAIVSLAVGIGANTAIFSVLDALLLRPPALRHLDRSLVVFHRNPRSAGEGMSFRGYQHYRERTDIFANSMAVAGARPLVLTDGARRDQVYAEPVTSSFFTMTSIQLRHGAPFPADVDRRAGSAPVVVLSHAFWSRRFNANPSVVGTTVTLNGQPFTVTGVADEGFTGLDAEVSVDMWIPIATWAAVVGEPARLSSDEQWVTMVAELAPGVSLAQAGAAMAIAGQALAPPEGQQTEVRAAANGLAGNATDAMAMAGAAFGIGLVVLALACTNVANLLMARAAARQHEMAVRLALGSGRARLLRLWVAESLGLSVPAAALGLMVASWLLSALTAFRPPALVGHADAPSLPLVFHVDWRVFAFALALTVVTALVVGLLSGLQSSRAVTMARMHTSRGSDRHFAPGFNVRSAVIALQMALSTALLVPCGLFVRSALQANTAEPGFETANVVLLPISADQTGVNVRKPEGFERDLAERVRRLSGVAAATVMDPVPLWFGGNFARYEIPGHGAQRIGHASVGLQYFATMRIPLLAGRDFDPTDSASAPNVAIVNETMARRFWPGTAAIGQRLRTGGGDVEIVGIAKDARYLSVAEPKQLWLYRPFAQLPTTNPALSLAVRTTGDPVVIQAAIEREVRTLVPDWPAFRFRTLDEGLRLQQALPRLAAMLLGGVGLFGLFLAALGIYGVMAYVVRQRRQELAIRLALGAPAARVIALVVRQGMAVCVAGGVAGLLAAVAAAQLAASVLYGIGGVDPATCAAVTAMLFAVALVACYRPVANVARGDRSIYLLISRCD